MPRQRGAHELVDDHDGSRNLGDALSMLTLVGAAVGYAASATRKAPAPISHETVANTAAATNYVRHRYQVHPDGSNPDFDRPAR
jgi:hypothetical protein